MARIVTGWCCREQNNNFIRRATMFIIKRYQSGLLISLLCVLLTSGLATAQTVTGTISGTVVDASDHAIAGATVTLVNEKTGDTRTVTTNESGGFTVPALQPGIYTARVEQKGFRI